MLVQLQPLRGVDESVDDARGRQPLTAARVLAGGGVEMAVHDRHMLCP